MQGSLEIYCGDYSYEMEGNQVDKVTETQGQIEALIEPLQFTLATTFTIAPLDKQPPDVA